MSNEQITAGKSVLRGRIKELEAEVDLLRNEPTKKLLADAIERANRFAEIGALAGIELASARDRVEVLEAENRLLKTRLVTIEMDLRVVQTRTQFALAVCSMREANPGSPPSISQDPRFAPAQLVDGEVAVGA